MSQYRINLADLTLSEFFDEEMLSCLEDAPSERNQSGNEVRLAMLDTLLARHEKNLSLTQAASLFLRLGQLHQLSHEHDSLKNARLAFDRGLQAVAEPKNDDERELAAVIWMNRGAVCLNEPSGDAAIEAVHSYAEAIRIFESMTNPPCARLGAALLNQALALNKSAEHMQDTRAEEALNRAVAILGNCSSPDAQRNLAAAWSNLAALLDGSGKTDGAMQALSRADEILMSLVHEPGAQIERSAVLLNLGQIHLRQDRLDQARDVFLQAKIVSESWAQRSPVAAEVRIKLAHLSVNDHIQNVRSGAQRPEACGDEIDHEIDYGLRLAAHWRAYGNTVVEEVARALYVAGLWFRCEYLPLEINPYLRRYPDVPVTFLGAAAILLNQTKQAILQKGFAEGADSGWQSERMQCRQLDQAGEWLTARLKKYQDNHDIR